MPTPRSVVLSKLTNRRGELAATARWLARADPLRYRHKWPKMVAQLDVIREDIAALEEQLQTDGEVIE